MTDNPFAQPLRKTMNDPRLDWARPQKVRRRLVTIFALLVLMQPMLIAVTAQPLIIILLFVPFVFLMGSLNAGIRGMTELRSRDLDEREDLVRNSVYARLYWPGLFLGILSALMMGSLAVKGNLLVTGAGLSCFYIAVGLPALWLAWTLPDEPGAE